MGRAGRRERRVRWVEGVEEIHPGDMPTPRVAMGTFDGLHLGHRAVIREVLDLQKSSGGSAVVVTFEPYPQEILSPERSPARLTTPEEKRVLLGSMGVDATVALRFDRRMAAMDAAGFFRTVLGHLGMKSLFVGYNFTVGRERGGDLETLRRIGKDLGFDVRIVSPVLHEGSPISSTRIRGRVRDGGIDSANEMLGHAYAMHGRVVEGSGRGRSLGYPTANLALDDERKLLPADGVYAVWTVRRGERLAGIMNVGRRPTFGAEGRSVEVHVMDFRGDMYGDVLTVEIVDRLRKEERFADEVQLRIQIGHDVEIARQLLDRRTTTRDCP